VLDTVLYRAVPSLTWQGGAEMLRNKILYRAPKQREYKKQRFEVFIEGVRGSWTTRTTRSSLDTAARWARGKAQVFKIRDRKTGDEWIEEFGSWRKVGA
jgi:hypothetical protein